MPPKKAQSIGLSRRQQKSTSSAIQPKPNSDDSSISKVKIIHSNRTKATAGPTISKSSSAPTSEKKPLESNPVTPVSRSASKRKNQDTSNRANDPTPERTNTSTLLADRRKPAIGETMEKKTKAFAHSSEHAITRGMDEKLRGSGDASISTATRHQKKLNDAPVEETSTAATFSASKSSLIDRRKRGSSKFQLSENSRRRSKRLSLDVGKSPRVINSNASDASGDLSTEVLLGHNWRIFRVSPLYGFSRTPRALKQYGRELRTYLTATRAALPDAAAVRYTTAFTVLPELRWDDNRPEALQVEVFSLLEGRKPITLYSGILLSWGKQMPHSTADKCSLPLLLCKGVWRTATNVHTVLSRLFDVVIQPMELSQSDLKWISVISMKMEEPPPDKPLMMHYVFGTRRVLSFSVSALRVHNVWCEIHDGNIHMVSKEEVEKFSDILEQLGSTTLCVELRGLVLARIDFPNVTLTKDGHLRIRNIESVDLILRYFCSEAILRDAFFEDFDLTNTDSE